MITEKGVDRKRREKRDGHKEEKKKEGENMKKREERREVMFFGHSSPCWMRICSRHLYSYSM